MSIKKTLLFVGSLMLLGCSTSPTETSAQVTEYQSIDEMKQFANCEAIDAVNDTYDVTLHSPWGRKRAAHIRLKDAAYAKGANAVIMTSNNYGVVTDQVQGVAYKCTYGNK
ncbi:hypothetical protein A1L58_22130 [Shewanella baltica]|uniref:hypothetical protein n=1 Tax=Shewanella TaxID=22 RepID=UPI0007B4E150|nr:hypothetical protein [Shewanella baltica]KZK65507.1 hypothetical protein A1L58_22130 [Shewanella baltica]